MTLIGDQELARRLGAAGRITGAQLSECLGELMRRRARGETPTLSDLLLERGLVTPGDLTRVTGRLKAPKLPRMPRVGEALCGYQVVRQLGSGNMGSVYLARGAEGSVAIKVLHGGSGASPLRHERFEREAKALAGLDHPGIVRLIKAELSAQLPCLVFEYVPGRTLGDVFATPTLPVEDKLGLLVQVCRAVHVAHQRGIVHRDLKPENVLVCGGIAKVADFGVARDLSRDTRLTQTGGLVGSPNYMAPEQVQGGEITPQTDVYALGVLLYELLCGEVPFHAETPIELYQLILSGRVEPPSRRSEAADARHDAVCLKALARDPTRRYGSALDLAEAIDALRAPAPPRSSSRALLVVLATAAAALLLLLPLGAMLGTSLATHPHQAKGATPTTTSVLQRAPRDPQPEPTDPAPETLAPVDVAALIADAGERRRQGDVSGAVACLDQALAAAPEDGGLWRTRARLKHELGDLEGASNDYDRAIALEPSDAVALSYRANARFALGRYRDAIADYSRSLRIRPRDARNLFNRGNARFEAGELEGAIEDYTRALRVGQDVPPEAIYRARGIAHRAAGDAGQAMRDFERFLEMRPHEAQAVPVRRWLAELRGYSSGPR